ncbi:uncharacterized protein LOC18440188 [Amborella trichopoda]|nr:uncharacterized protein LOC18440188 [Amborella trichopoda]XP_020526612.1 uncharacterized protein LOC18440188 [Amborella trichopoda]XP_020526613.1 uncharacterized protein LOC18440188 [Amborella trichopoda]XP_020526614.1 uncharacterized protein LOC18440188 [Amborella trichopoda]XP_020526615.1 uncharacterized protein LOC18440188 [Amborella trichopoda]|eukprot:XP_006850403.2 uncharacterized protein LOC18440188 [Amborella trichopoda]
MDSRDMPSEIKADHVNMDHLESERVGFHVGGRKSPIYHPPKSSTKTQTRSPRGRRSSRLIDKCGTSDPNIHGKREGSIPSKSSEKHKNHRERRDAKANEAEEIVKYMSNLPCYLQCKEGGSSLQEKALNFGVLDWKRLENWKETQKQGPGQRNVDTISFKTVNTSTQPHESGKSSLARKRRASIDSSNSLHTLLSAIRAQSLSSDQNTSNQNVAHHGSVSSEQMSNINSQNQERDQAISSKNIEHSSQKEETLETEDSKQDTIVSNAVERDSLLSDVQCSSGSNSREMKGSNGSNCKEREVKTLGSPSHDYETSDQLSARPKSFSFREGLGFRYLNPRSETQNQATARPEEPNGGDSLPVDKEKTCSKTRFSSFTRMIEPLVKSSNISKDRTKPKNLHSSFFTECKAAEQPSTVRSKSCNQKTMKKGFRLSKSLSTNDFKGSWQSEKNTSDLMVHAFLQCLYQNGMPFYTFSLNGDRSFLASVGRKILTSEKDSCDWLYTFHSFTDIKKRNSGVWINQGKKQNNHVQASNMVGQMEVSCFLQSRNHAHGSLNHFVVREFVLYSTSFEYTKLGNPVGKTSSKTDSSDFLETHYQFHPYSELAAMVIKVPLEEREILRSENKAVVDERDCELEREKQPVSSIEVILPSDAHGIPNEEESNKPSSLIERWRTGGSCDCGGWDMGCSLTILCEQHPHSEDVTSIQGSHGSDTGFPVDLFIRGSQGNRPAISMGAIRNGLYMIDYDKFLTPLQVFSICVALLHCRKPACFSENWGPHKEKALPESSPYLKEYIAMDTQKDQREIHLSYIPDPPLSPVGRV